MIFLILEDYPASIKLLGNGRLSAYLPQANNSDCLSTMIIRQHNFASKLAFIFFRYIYMYIYLKYIVNGLNPGVSVVRIV